jgi:hypothetical protein
VYQRIYCQPKVLGLNPLISPLSLFPNDILPLFPENCHPCFCLNEPHFHDLF